MKSIPRLDGDLQVLVVWEHDDSEAQQEALAWLSEGGARLGPVP